MARKSGSGKTSGSDKNKWGWKEYVRVAMVGGSTRVEHARILLLIKRFESCWHCLVAWVSLALLSSLGIFIEQRRREKTKTIPVMMEESQRRS